MKTVKTTTPMKTAPIKTTVGASSKYSSTPSIAVTSTSTPASTNENTTSSSDGHSHADAFAPANIAQASIFAPKTSAERAVTEGFTQAADEGAKSVGLALISSKLANSSALPKWYPKFWDIDVAAHSAKNLLVAQGEDPARIKRDLVDHVVFTDADHTLVNTTTPVLLRDASTNALVHHPETGDIVTLPSRGYQDAFEDLQKAFPKRDWSSVGFDYSGMADAAELHRHDHIESTAEVLRENRANGRGRQFIITARSSDNIPAAFLEYTQERGMHLDGTFPVNGQRYIDAMDFSRFDLDTGARKAMTMAALLKLYEPKNGVIETVRFYEDSDPNLRSAMELLPKLFPKTKFEFWDVIHNEEGGFDAELVATNDGPQVIGANGKPMTDVEIATYQSDDADMPEHTGGISFPTDIPENQE